jgi:hypothetical protein
MSDAGITYLAGLIFVSVSFGFLISNLAAGCLVFGVGLLAAAMMSFLSP